MDMPSPHPHRKSLRLGNYDYSSPGAYFITLCVQEKRCLFGDVVDGAMHCNAPGQMVLRWYGMLGSKFPDIRTDAIAVMPNHLHCILFNVGADPRVRPLAPSTAAKTGEQDASEAPAGAMGSSLPEVVQWFKTMTTNEYIRGVKQQGWLRFDGRLWQRNYYEHVIRSEGSLQAIREYIVNNPAQWHLDRENPAYSGDP